MNDPQAETPAWLLPLVGFAFPLAMTGMWVLVTTLLAWVSGHRALLVRYPPVAEPTGESFGFASGDMRGVNYRGALYVGFGQQGLHLAPNGLFRSPFLRGIPCIAWDDLRCTRVQAAGFFGSFRGSQFEIASMGLRFTLRGEPGLALERRLGANP